MSDYMPFDEQKFSALQGVIKQKLSEFYTKQEPKLFEGTSLGGKVSVKILLSNLVEYKVQEVKIDPALLNEKALMIEDLVRAALDDAFKKTLEYNKGFMGSLVSLFLA